MSRIHLADLTLGEVGCPAKSNFAPGYRRLGMGRIVRAVSVRVFPNDSFWGCCSKRYRAMAAGHGAA